MSPRAQILEWAERGHLQNLDAALDLAQITPSPEKWRTFLSRLMLATGTLLFGAGVIFFFAYNWKGLPPIARFAIVEALPATTQRGATTLAEAMKPTGQPVRGSSTCP